MAPVTMMMDYYVRRLVRIQTWLFLAGVGASLFAAASFNLAGLLLSPSGFNTGQGWDPDESGFLVAFGVGFLLVWICTVLLGVLVVRSDENTDGVRIYGRVLVILSVLIALVVLFVGLVILPLPYQYRP